MRVCVCVSVCTHVFRLYDNLEGLSFLARVLFKAMTTAVLWLDDRYSSLVVDWLLLDVQYILDIMVGARLQHRKLVLVV